MANDSHRKILVMQELVEVSSAQLEAFLWLTIQCNDTIPEFESVA